MLAFCYQNDIIVLAKEGNMVWVGLILTLIIIGCIVVLALVLYSIINILNELDVDVKKTKDGLRKVILYLKKGGRNGTC